MSMMQAAMSSMKLKDIVPAVSNNIDMKLIIVEKGRAICEGQSKMCLALAADETAAVHLQLWGDECDALEAGDIIRIEKGIFSFDRRKNLVLRAGRRGKVVKQGEFTMVFVETPNMSEIRWVCDSSNKFVQHSIVSTHSRSFTPLPWCLSL